MWPKLSKWNKYSQNICLTWKYFPSFVIIMQNSINFLQKCNNFKCEHVFTEMSTLNFNLTKVSTLPCSIYHMFRNGYKFSGTPHTNRKWFKTVWKILYTSSRKKKHGNTWFKSALLKSIYYKRFTMQSNFMTILNHGL